MEESQYIKRRLTINSSMYTVSIPKNVLISGAIVDYGSTSNEEALASISRQQ